MRKRDLLVVGIAAVVTATVALVVWETLPKAIADPEQVRIVSRAQSTLEVKGVALSLSPDQPTYSPGQTPVLKLRAVNGRDRAAELKVALEMMAARPASPMARMMPQPTKVWSHSCEISLQPKEDRTFEIPADVKLEAGTSAWLTLTVGGESLRSASFAVIEAPTAP